MGNMMRPVAAVYALAFYSMGALSQDQCQQPLMKANSVISSGPLVVDGDVEDMSESTPCLEVVRCLLQCQIPPRYIVALR